MIKKKIIIVMSMLMMCVSIAGGCSSGLMAVADDIMARTQVTLEIARTEGVLVAAQRVLETSHFIVARWMGRVVDVSFDGPNGIRLDRDGNESVPVIVPYDRDLDVWIRRVQKAAHGFVKLHIPYRLLNISVPAPGQKTTRCTFLQSFSITTRPFELETAIDFEHITSHYALIDAVHDQFEERGGSYEGVLRFGEVCENRNEGRCIFRLVVNVADSGQLEKLLEQLYLLCFELAAMTDSDLIRQAMKDFTIKEARHILDDGLLVYHPSPAETIASGFSEEEWAAIRGA